MSFLCVAQCFGCSESLLDGHQLDVANHHNKSIPWYKFEKRSVRKLAFQLQGWKLNMTKTTTQNSSIIFIYCLNNPSGRRDWKFTEFPQRFFAKSLVRNSGCLLHPENDEAYCEMTLSNYALNMLKEPQCARTQRCASMCKHQIKHSTQPGRLRFNTLCLHSPCSNIPLPSSPSAA